MADRRYECFMVHSKIGANRKIRRLKPAERWCFIGGVLAIAAESPVRGTLLLTEGIPADESDIANAAGVHLALARKTMRALRELKIVYADDDLRCDVVHDFEEWNPAPKPSDSRKAWRERKQKQRDTGGSHAGRRRDKGVTSRGEVKGSKDPPVVPPGDAALDLPDELRPFVPKISDVLAKVAAEKQGAQTPTQQAVANVLRRFPNKDFLPLAEDFAHWWIHGQGGAKNLKDIVRAYRNWIEKEPDVLRKTTPNGKPVDEWQPGMDPESRRRLEEAER